MAYVEDVEIYPRLVTTIFTSAAEVGSHPSLRYSFSHTLYRSLGEEEHIVPRGSTVVVTQDQNEKVSKPLHDLAGYISQGAREPGEIKKRLRGIGEWIANNLLSPEHLCCCHGNEIPNTIIFVPDRQDIPWELTWLGDHFLAQKVIHARYPLVRVGRKDRIRYPSVPSMAIIVGKSGGLFSAEMELKELQDEYSATFSGEKVAVFDGEKVTIDFIRDVLSGSIGTFDIIHFIGHGDASADEVWLDLLGPPFLAKNIPRIIKGNPLVFWNCCFSADNNRAIMRYQSDAVEGFGAGLLSRGAGHFIGQLFPVVDHTAKDFAVEFYRQLFAKSEVGSAFYHAKSIVSEADPLAITYVLYGNPEISVVSNGS